MPTSSSSHPQTVSVLDFQAVGDGKTDCYHAIQAALDSGAGHVVVPSGTYVIRNALLPREGQAIEIHGTLKIADALVQPLAMDMAIGDSEVNVADASEFFVGQWVIIHDDRLPMQGGGRKVRRQNAGCAKIAEISGNTLRFEVQSARSYLREANAIVATQHSAIMIHESNVRIFGTGIIDGNKHNQFNAAPGLLQLEGGMEGINASGIAVAAFPDRVENVVIEGVTVVDPVLHGIRMKDCDRGVVRHTRCLRAHDKNICFERVRECAVLHNYACDSEWEDGIQFHQKADPELCSSRVKIEGNVCTGNARTGIGVGAGMSDFYLANNLCANNGVNISLRGDRIISNHDVALGCNGNLFPLSAPRPSVQVAGRTVVLNHLTALGSPSAVVGIAGSDITLHGGLIGDMELELEGNEGIGLDIRPDRRASSEPSIVPERIQIDHVTVRNCRKVFRLDPGAGPLVFRQNVFIDNAETGTVPPELAATLRFHENDGLISKNRGVARIAPDQTRVSVLHGLFCEPELAGLTVTPVSHPGDATRFWVENPGPESFDIVLDQVPGQAGATFAWTADAGSRADAV